MIWTLDMDDFRGQFCCQGKFPLIRTIKAVLHGQLKLLPKEKICSTCPTKEYKGIKQIYRKREKQMNAYIFLQILNRMFNLNHKQLKNQLKNPKNLSVMQKDQVELFQGEFSFLILLFSTGRCM